MKIGLIGFPQVGKKTLFQLLTEHKLTEKDLSSNKPTKGVAEIRDPRFDRLVAMYKPRKMVRARIDIELLPKIEKDTIEKGDIFADINELDAICHVVRVFRDDSIYHIDGSVDPKRDIDFVNSELLLHDLIFIEKRLERIEQKIKVTKDELSLKEKDLLLKLKGHLDKTLPLRLLGLDHDENKVVASYPLITRKEMIIVLNVSEDSLGDKDFVSSVGCELSGIRAEVMQVSAKVEEEIASLESDAERSEFLKAMGVTEPAVSALTRLCLKALALVSFFTVGEDEVRQWLVKRSSAAPEAAGAIHTDLQKGFIRAEVMKCDELFAAGSENKLKEAGKYYLKGKDYIVEDGDIINVRFSV